ncbi:TrkH family potassium uptake protein [Shumkonia mesophila]|uniref:TrkH family potassium uptake protein n=1 Tax=Shumkonia mesophila TaxID=2838854 RepID=UPI002934C02A|nr:TrkH family potassium uptake protein [Shumkonia mesophila]
MSLQDSSFRIRSVNRLVDGPASTAGAPAVRQRPELAAPCPQPFECAVLFIFGALAVILGLLMVVPAVVEIAADGKDLHAFLWSAALCIFVGMALVLTNRQESIVLNIRQTFLLTALAWFGLSFLAAIPFMFGHLELSLADAYFETVSGLTTTGSTVLAGLDTMPPGILLWRGLLQWIGGLGIIVMGVAVLPFLRVGGMQLFRTESSDRSEKLFGRVDQIAAAMLYVYGGLSVLCATLYWVGGMTVFEAAIHAMTTLSTGGYSTSDQSLAHFPSPVVHWTAVVFMLAGGLPVVPLAHALAGGFRALIGNSQVRAILGFLAVVIATMALWLWVRNDIPLADALRFAAFNVVSVVTTTGYANADYGQWGPLAVGLFFVLIFVGGCTGSTGGGIKIFRFQVIGRIIGGHFRTLVTPHAVSVTLYEGRLLDDGVIRSVMIFTATFIATVTALGLILVALGLDFMTGFSGAATAVANVGPGLGEIIGPAGNFASLPDSAKWALAVGMLLGRLEFFTVLVVLTPRFWRG